MQIQEASAASQEEFKKRRSMFSGRSDGRVQALHSQMTTDEFIKAEGMSIYSASLVKIADEVRTLQRAGAQKSSVKRCLDHIVKSSYESPAAFSPGARRSSP